MKNKSRRQKEEEEEAGEVDRDKNILFFFFFLLLFHSHKLADKRRNRIQRLTGHDEFHFFFFVAENHMDVDDRLIYCSKEAIRSKIALIRLDPVYFALEYLNMRTSNQCIHSFIHGRLFAPSIHHGAIDFQMHKL